MSETSDGGGDLSLDPLDSVTLERIRVQLDYLIPEAKRWRHHRWLTWLALGVAGLTAALAIFTVGFYLHDRGADQAEDREAAAATEQALRADCDVAATNAQARNRALTLAFSDFGVAAGAAFDVPATEIDAFLAGFIPDLEEHLAESVPPRDCEAEAADRAADG